MRRSFTLIEILVVMAIIAILAAMMLPVLHRATARGRQSNCSGQIKQIGVACAIYAGEDSKGGYPGPYPHGMGAAVKNCSWQKVIGRLQGSDLSMDDYYVKGQPTDFNKSLPQFKSLLLFSCPSEGRDIAKSVPLSYILNIGTGESVKGLDPLSSRISLGKISSAAGTVQLLESHKCAYFAEPVDLGTTGAEATVSVLSTGEDSKGAAVTNGRPNNIDQHYNDKAMPMHGGPGHIEGNSLFFDAHAELLEQAEIKQNHYLIMQYRK